MAWELTMKTRMMPGLSNSLFGVCFLDFMQFMCLGDQTTFSIFYLERITDHFTNAHKNQK